VFFTIKEMAKPGLPLALLTLINIGLSTSTRVTLYENMNKLGEELKLREISNCTNLPDEWQDRTSSLNIHKSVCLKVFEHNDCKGKYVTLKASLHSDSEYLDNLRELEFNDVISSVSPCALQIQPGVYVVQNLGDNKMMTLVKRGVYSTIASRYWRNLRMQHWDIQLVAGSTILYEFRPVGERPHFEQPVVYDNADLLRMPAYRIETPAFLIESVDDWKYVIRDSRTKLCFATIKGESETIKPVPCAPLAKNQQWIFRKVS